MREFGEKPDTKRRFMWMHVITGILLIITSLGFARMSYGVVMPFMRQGLSLTYGQSGMLGTVTSFGYLSMVTFAGVLTVRFGGKQMILLGGVVITCSLLGLSWAPSYASALLMMFLAGVGTALTFTPLVSLMVAWFPKQKGLVLGFMLSGVGIASFATGIIVPLMVRQFPPSGWRSAWALFGIFALVVLIVAALILKNPPHTHSFSSTSRQQAINLTVSIYKNKGVLLIAFIYFCVGVSYLIPTIFQMGFMLAKHVDSRAAGQIIAVGGVLTIISGPVWGYISDQIGRRTTLLISLAIVILGTMLPVITPRLPGFVASQIMLGCTVGGAMSQIQVVATEQVPLHLAPVSLGYVTLFFAAGQLLGPGIAGWTIDHLGGFQTAYLFAAIVTLIGTIFSLGIKGGSFYVHNERADAEHFTR